MEHTGESQEAQKVENQTFWNRSATILNVFVALLMLFGPFGGWLIHTQQSIARLEFKTEAQNSTIAEIRSDIKSLSSEAVVRNERLARIEAKIDILSETLKEEKRR